MSTVHCSPYWRPVALGVEAYKDVDNQNIINGWKVKETTKFSFTMRIFASMINDLLNSVAEAAKKMIKNAPTEKKGFPFRVNTDKDVKFLVDEKRGTLFYKNNKEVIDHACALMQNYISKVNENTHRMMLAHEVPENTFMFNYSMRPHQVEERIKKMVLHSHAYFYEQLKVKSSGKCTLTQDDIEFLGGAQIVSHVDAKKISCMQYTLLKNRETEAKQSILTAKEMDLKIDTLKNWNYRIVTHPNVGDLVLYMDVTGTKIQHLGSVIEDEDNCELLVESKWGYYNSDVYIHPIFDVPPFYGEKVIFMRKPSL